MHLILSSCLLASALADAPVITPYELLRMEAVIRMPVETPFEVTNFRRDRRVLLMTAVRLEIFDANEVSWRVPEPEYFQIYLDEIRELLEELSDCPLVAEGDWLPEATFCAKVREFHDAWEEYLRVVAEWNEDWVPRIQVALDEGRRIRVFYTAAEWARAPYMSAASRRTHLRTLRQMIGPDAWAEHRLPETAVWWSFQER